MVPVERFYNARWQVPPFGQIPTDSGMGCAEHLVFDVSKHRLLHLRGAHDISVALRHILDEHEFSQVVNRTGEHGKFRSLAIFAQSTLECRRRHTTGKAVLPEFFLVQCLNLGRGQSLKHASCQHQVFNHLQAQEDDGAIDRLDLPALAEKKQSWQSAGFWRRQLGLGR